MEMQKLKGSRRCHTLTRLSWIAICVLAPWGSGLAASKAQPTTASLKNAFQDDFLVGTALNPRQFTEQDLKTAALVKEQFNAITPENVLKWAVVHPEPERYDFGPSDRFVEFGERNGMTIIGHTLVWHSQTPRWVFEDVKGETLDRDALLNRMSNHIHAVVGRYKGRIEGWDVVNEALNEDGSLRQSPWLKIIGEDYIAKAFEFAHAADPEAGLYYNDYSLENEPKRIGAVRLVKNLQTHGVPITGIGTQMHAKMDWPSLAQIDDTLSAFGQLGIDVMVTELDIDVLPAATRNLGADVGMRIAENPALNPYVDGLPEAVEQALTERYREMFQMFVRHRDNLTRVTFWGVTDNDSWLNNWPVRGRTNYPLLFDRDGKPKPAFEAVIKSVP